MNRRGFLKRFAQVSALCAAAPALLSTKEKISGPIPPFRVKEYAGAQRATINPEWQQAPIEIRYLTCGEHKRVIKDPWPWRFRNQASAEHFIRVMNEVYKGC